MDKIFIKPAPGLKVPDPFSGGYLPAQGAKVNRNAYWLRQLKDKSVTLFQGAVNSNSNSDADADDSDQIKKSMKGKVK